MMSRKSRGSALPELAMHADASGAQTAAGRRAANEQPTPVRPAKASPDRVNEAGGDGGNAITRAEMVKLFGSALRVR